MTRCTAAATSSAWRRQRRQRRWWSLKRGTNKEQEKRGKESSTQKPLLRRQRRRRRRCRRRRRRWLSPPSCTPSPLPSRLDSAGRWKQLRDVGDQLFPHRTREKAAFGLGPGSIFRQPRAASAVGGGQVVPARPELSRNHKKSERRMQRGKCDRRK